MEYQAAVAEARMLVKRSEDAQWRLAELTWEQVEAGSSAAQWARDIGIHRNHATALRRTWEKFGDLDKGDRPRWTDAYAEAVSPTYQEQGWETGRAKSTIRNMPPEQKAEVVREALAEPEVAERVVRDTPTRSHLARAENKVEREREDTARDRYNLTEPRSAQIGALADLEYALTRTRQSADDASGYVDDLEAHGWPDNSRERGAILAQRAAAAIEVVRAKLEGRGLDQELAALLSSDDDA